MEYDNTNRGTLGKNERKTESKHADYTGKLNVDGVQYKLSGWINTRKSDGHKFISLKIEKAGEYKKPEEQPKPKQETNFFDDLTDDPPF